MANDRHERSTVYAPDASQAAEKFAAWWWDSDSPPNDGATLEVTVFGDGDRETFEVVASWSLTCMARRRP